MLWHWLVQSTKPLQFSVNQFRTCSSCNETSQPCLRVCTRPPKIIQQQPNKGGSLAPHMVLGIQILSFLSEVPLLFQRVFGLNLWRLLKHVPLASANVGFCFGCFQWPWEPFTGTEWGPHIGFWQKKIFLLVFNLIAFFFNCDKKYYFLVL